jgi:small subunit ribosomal protein S20
MANHISASKRNRQRVVRTARGRAYRTRLRTAIKAANAAIEGKADNAAQLVRQATSLLDQAATKNAIPTKRASRLKGRLASKFDSAARSEA